MGAWWGESGREVGYECGKKDKHTHRVFFRYIFFSFVMSVFTFLVLLLGVVSQGKAVFLSVPPSRKYHQSQFLYICSLSLIFYHFPSAPAPLPFYVSCCRLWTGLVGASTVVVVEVVVPCRRRVVVFIVVVK